MGLILKHTRTGAAYRRLTKGAILAVASAAAVPVSVSAQPQGEGSFQGTYYFTAEVSVTETAPQRYAWTSTSRGIGVNDSGSGFFNKIGLQCTGTGFLTNPEGGERVTGHCLATDRDGDHFTTQFALAKGRANDPLQGEDRIERGTGKYAGLMGGWHSVEEWHFVRRSPTNPFHELVFGANHEMGRYRFGGPTQGR
jgi:hypothetical protein